MSAVTTQQKTNAADDPVAAVPKQLFISGQWRDASGGKVMEVVNPATGETLCSIADATPEDGLAAAAAAAKAQRAWARTGPRERSDILRRAYELLHSRVDELALLMTLEMGKPLADARGEVAYAAEFFRWFSEEAVRIEGDFATLPNGKTRRLVLRQPVGPCLLITPWNFPLAMGARKVGPAIAAGCTMVLKPAPQTPLSSLALATVLKEAGLPDGVLNIVTTTDAGGVIEPLLRSGEVIRKLSFTGSTQVGRLLLSQCSDAVLRTSLELGGNAPLIVFDDADVDVAVEGAMAAKMRNMGEACTAANRMFVQRGIYDEFTRRFTERMSQMKVGPGTQDGVQVGPLIDEAGRSKVQTLVEDAVSRGADVLTGGTTPDGRGYFYPPTVLSGVSTDSSMLSTEVFGPVAPLIPFDTEDEVLTLANATEFGLVGYIFTRDLARSLRVSEELEVGMVGVNTGIVSDPAAPFGGIKQSGLGREGGRVGIEEFLEIKYIAMPV
ncbi:MAG TPA: NAD-dependent succinate-semialdehyde dehydrogenase [Pseudonocardia sp.]|jgi:succinate-semialdehyde dehydrogenase/glutarate-semialdehyde dehydrogenase|nr:NAD-dependent succinate-semialdehyde dehydrogenase [Pseudonocardia sp.]